MKSECTRILLSEESSMKLMARSLTFSIAAAAAMLLISTAVAAQGRGGRGGTPDWPPAGPTPRTADGHPDLSGNWQPNAIGQNDITWLDQSGIPHSTDMKVTERFTRTDFGHLEVVHIIDDPKTFSKPWTFTTHPSLLRGELIEYICQENNKDVEHLIGK